MSKSKNPKQAPDVPVPAPWDLIHNFQIDAKVEELRRTVETLQQRIAELEAQKKK